MPIVTNEFVDMALGARAAYDAMEDAIIDIKAYLLSEKFSEERWVNPDDILLRLQEAQRAAADAAVDARVYADQRRPS